MYFLTTHSRLLAPLGLLVLTLLIPGHAAADNDPLEIVVQELVSESQPLHPIATIDPAKVGAPLAMRSVTTHSDDSFVSSGVYPGPPDVLEPVDVSKAIDLLNQDFELSANVFNQTDVDVAYNTSTGDYLVVYRLDTSASTSAIFGRRVSAAGVPIGSEFAVIQEAGFQLAPRIVYNPTSNEFMVVCWQIDGALSAAIARVVPAVGTPTALVWDPFPTFTNVVLPTVAWNQTNNEYAIAAGQNNGDAILINRMSAGSGIPLGSNAILQSADGVVDAAPDITVNPATGNYLIAAERTLSGARWLFLYRITSDLISASVAGGFALATDILAPAVVVDTGRNEAFLAFRLVEAANPTSADMAVGVINLATAASSRLAFYSNVANDFEPRLAYQSAEDDFLITWFRSGATSPVVATIQGGTTTRLVNESLSSLATGVSDPAVAVNGTESLVVWPELQTPARIRGRRLGTAAPVLSVNPTSLNFGTTTTSLGVTLTNTGTGQLQWGTSAPAYVTRTPGFGLFFDSDSTSIGINRAGLTPGDYSTTLTFLVTNGADVNVPVTMTVPNTAPGAPSNPIPANGAANQALAFTASWSHSEADVGQALTAQIYLSTNQSLVNTLDPSVLLATGSTGLTGGSFSISGLGNITTYYWRVVISDGTASTPGPTWSFTTQRVDMTTLTPIDDLITDATPTFQWSAVAGAASYRLEVGTDPDFGNLVLNVGGLTGTSYTPPSDLGDDEYFWSVATVAPNGTESLTPSADAFTIDTTPPAVPTLGVLVSPTSNARPPLSWSASPGATSYNLQVATDVAFTNVVIQSSPSTNAFTPTTDLAEGTYHWRVAAVDEAGNQSAFSVVGSFEIDQTPPSVPTLIAVSDPISNQRPTLSWNAATGAAAYRIQVSNDGFATTLFDESDLSGTSFTPTSDLPEDTISWRVLAVDEALNASVFSTANTFTVDVTAPAVPVQGAVPDPTNNLRQTLSWNAVAGAVEYLLRVDLAPLPPNGPAQPKGTTVFNGTVTGTSWTPTSDLPEERLIWDVASLDAAGNQSAFSPTDTFTVDVTAPAVPVLTPVADPISQVRPTLTWATVLGAATYRIQISTAPGFGTILFDTTVATPAFTPSSDLPESTIYWRVASQDAAGNGSIFSVADSFLVDVTAPGTPVPDPVPNPTNNPRPTLTWSAVPGAVEYLLFVGPGPSAPVGELASTEGVVFFSGTVNGTSWTPEEDLPEGGVVWGVASRDAALNQSSFSPPGVFTIDVTPPSVPTLTPAADPNNQARPTLIWSSVADAASYRIQVATEPGFKVPLFNTTDTLTVWSPPTDLPETTIYWRVASIDLAGNQGAFSAPDSFLVDVTAPGVSVLVPVPDPTNNPRPTLTWSAVPDAVEYLLVGSPAPEALGASPEGIVFFSLRVTGTSWTPKEDLPEERIGWGVVAIDGAGNQGPFSLPDEFTVDLTPPAVPTLTPATDPTSNVRPTFAWGFVADAVSYRIQVSTEAGFQTALFDTTVSGTSFTPSSDLPEGTIYWRVAGLDLAGNESAFSAADDFMIDLTAPSPPVLIPVTPDPTNDPRPTLSWNAVSGAAEYHVVATAGAELGSLIDTIVVGTSFTPSTDLPDGPISWQVASRDALGNEGTFSNADMFTVDTTPPGVPVLTPVTDPTNDPRPTLGWSAVTGAAEYRVQVATDGGFGALLFDVTVAGASWAPTSDLPEGSVFWRVASRDGVGNESAFSAADDFTVDTTPPGVPVLAPVTDPTNDPRPTLSWSAVAGAADYRVQVATDAGFGVTLFDVTVSGTSWTPTADLPEDTIFWRAASRDALGNESAFSAADDFMVDLTAPSPPGLIPVTPDPTSDPRPTLSWNAVSGAAEYHVVATAGAELGSLIDTIVVGTSFTPSTDLPDGPISWQVASRDALGNEGTFSNADTFTIDTTPPGVPVLTPVTDPTNDPRPTLGWNAVADAAEYRVQVATDGSFGALLFDVTVVGASWAPPSDLPEGSVFWRVASRDAVGNESAFSAANDFAVDTTPPDVPVLAPVTDPTNDPRPTLSWSAVAGAADYRVQVATDGGFGTTVFDITVSGTSWTPTADLPEDTIFWRAASRDALGNESAFSAADNFMVDLSAPSPPVLIPVTPDPTSDPRPTLSWNAVSGAADYHVVATAGAELGSLIDTIVVATSFTPSADLPDGPISWQVASRDALGNEGTFSNADTFTVDTTPPGVPVLTPVTDPTNDPRPTLGWNAVAGAAEYRVQVAIDGGFGALLFDVTVSGTTWTPTSDLPKGPIFWRVASRDGVGNESAFSAADMFAVDLAAPAPPTLTPVTPDPTMERRPELAWSVVADAAAYRLQVSTDVGFGSTLFDQVLASNVFIPTSDLPEGPIFWRVASRDGVGNEGVFSAADDFTVDVTAPSAIAGLRSQWETTTVWSLNWQASTEPDVAFYAIYRELAPFTDTTGLTPVDTSITDPTVTRWVDSNPLPGQDGHYAVVAVDAAGNAITAVQSVAAPGPAPIFIDGFESGDTSGWSSATP